jgi:hypothetical protein
MVRVMAFVGVVEEITAAPFDEAYRDRLEEMDPPCPGMGIGPSSSDG